MGDADAKLLLSKISARCDASLAVLYDRFAARLYRLALGLTGRSADAEDAVAEVFLALVRRPENLGAIESLPAYLSTAVRNAVVKQIARREKDRAATEALVHRQPAPATENAEQDPCSERLRAALARLPMPQREVVSLKIYAELTFAEIAQVMEIGASTAASRYRYALEKLRAILGGTDHD